MEGIGDVHAACTTINAKLLYLHIPGYYDDDFSLQQAESEYTALRMAKHQEVGVLYWIYTQMRFLISLTKLLSMKVK